MKSLFTLIIATLIANPAFAKTSAEIVIDLAQVGSANQLAAVLSEVPEKIALDGETGSCLFSARIEGIVVQENKMIACLVFDVQREGKINCVGEARIWTKEKLRSIAELPAVKLGSGACEQ